MRRVVLLFVVLIGLTATSFAQSSSSPRPAASDKQVIVVNLNTATVTELEKLPGIGTRVATRIVEYRQKNGPFKKIEELMNVQGIGEKSFLKLRPQLTVGGKVDAAQQE